MLFRSSYVACYTERRRNSWKSVEIHAKGFEIHRKASIFMQKASKFTQKHRNSSKRRRNLWKASKCMQKASKFTEKRRNSCKRRRTSRKIVEIYAKSVETINIGKNVSKSIFYASHLARGARAHAHTTIDRGHTQSFAHADR